MQKIRRTVKFRQQLALKKMFQRFSANNFLLCLNYWKTRQIPSNWATSMTTSI